MMNHAQIVSRNLIAARRFYGAAARSLGLSVQDSAEGFVIGEAGGGAVLSVIARESATVDEQPETRPTLVAFEAPNGSSVRAFFREAMRAGGQDLRYPSPSPAFGPRAPYSAQVSDPDGNCIECTSRH